MIIALPIQTGRELEAESRSQSQLDLYTTFHFRKRMAHNLIPKTHHPKNRTRHLCILLERQPEKDGPVDMPKDNMEDHGNG